MKHKMLVLFLLAMLAGCNKLDSGIVIRKHFEPAHTEIYTTFIYAGKTPVPMVNSRWVPDEWRITVEGEHKGKIRRELFSVTEAEYESVNIGDFIQIREKRIYANE